MISLLDHLAVLHDENDVRIADGGEAVRDDKARSAEHEPREVFLYLDFRSRIDGRSRLVENEHGRQAEHDASDAQELFLPLREGAPVLADDGIVTV